MVSGVTTPESTDGPDSICSEKAESKKRARDIDYSDYDEKDSRDKSSKSGFYGPASKMLKVTQPTQEVELTLDLRAQYNEYLQWEKGYLIMKASEIKERKILESEEQYMEKKAAAEIEEMYGDASLECRELMSRIRPETTYPEMLQIMSEYSPEVQAEYNECTRPPVFEKSEEQLEEERWQEERRRQKQEENRKWEEEVRAELEAIKQDLRSKLPTDLQNLVVQVDSMKYLKGREEVPAKSNPELQAQYNEYLQWEKRYLIMKASEIKERKILESEEQYMERKAAAEIEEMYGDASPECRELMLRIRPETTYPEELQIISEYSPEVQAEYNKCTRPPVFEKSEEQLEEERWQEERRRQKQEENRKWEEEVRAELKAIKQDTRSKLPTNLRQFVVKVESIKSSKRQNAMLAKSNPELKVQYNEYIQWEKGYLIMKASEIKERKILESEEQYMEKKAAAEIEEMYGDASPECRELMLRIRPETTYPEELQIISEYSPEVQAEYNKCTRPPVFEKSEEQLEEERWQEERRRQKQEENRKWEEEVRAELKAIKQDLRSKLPTNLQELLAKEN